MRRGGEQWNRGTGKQRLECKIQKVINIWAAGGGIYIYMVTVCAVNSG